MIETISYNEYLKKRINTPIINDNIDIYGNIKLIFICGYKELYLTVTTKMIGNTEYIARIKFPYEKAMELIKKDELKPKIGIHITCSVDNKLTKIRSTIGNTDQFIFDKNIHSIYLLNELYYPEYICSGEDALYKNEYFYPCYTNFGIAPPNTEGDICPICSAKLDRVYNIYKYYNNK